MALSRKDVISMHIKRGYRHEIDARFEGFHTYDLRGSRSMLRDWRANSKGRLRVPYEQRTRRSRDRVLGGHVLPLTVMLTSVRAHLPARRHLAIYSSKLPGHSSHLPCRPSRWVWSALKLSFAAFPSSPAAQADSPKPSNTRFLVSSFQTATSSR